MSDPLLKSPLGASSKLTDEMVDRIKRQLLFGEAPPAGRNSGCFQKGQSGNPKGRPKKTPAAPAKTDTTPIGELALKEAGRVIQAREGDQLKDLTIIEAVLRAQGAAALKGDPWAQKHYIDRFEKSQNERAAAIEADHAYWQAHIEECAREAAEAARRGEARPVFYPDPTELIFKAGEFVKVLGPRTKEQADLHTLYSKWRDAFYVQSVLNERCVPPGEEDDGRANEAYLAANFIDQMLPQRFRLKDIELYFLMHPYEVMTKRELLKQARAIWRSLGIPLPRGYRFPMKGFVERFVESYQAK